MVMTIRVLTPDRVICSTTATEIILPSITGQIGILENHATLITALETGLLRMKVDNKWTPMLICGGLAEVEKNQITILVNGIEDFTNLKLSDARKDLEKATLAVENAETTKARLEAAIQLKKAAARLEAVSYVEAEKKKAKLELQ